MGSNGREPLAVPRVIRCRGGTRDEGERREGDVADRDSTACLARGGRGLGDVIRVERPRGGDAPVRGNATLLATVSTE